MTYVNAEPEVLSAAAGNLAGVGDSLTAGTAAAAAPTTGLVAPAADLVSAFAAGTFAAHGEMFQAVSAQAALIHQQMVATLSGNASAYAVTESANATSAG